MTEGGSHTVDNMFFDSRRSISKYLSVHYPRIVSVDAEVGYFIEFPDLPGCMTLVESIAEIDEMADEARALWIETAFSEGLDIPKPGSFRTAGDGLIDYS